MRSDDEIFDEVVAKAEKPPRLPSDSELRKLPGLKFIKTKAEAQIHGFRNARAPVGRNRDLPRVIVDFVDSGAPGGFAGRSESDNTYIIAIHVGHILFTKLLFDALFANRTFWPDLGNVNAERNDLPPIIANRDFMEVCQSLGTRGFRPADYIPKDALRNTLATQLAYWANTFMIGHEFRHIISGHVDYYNQNFSLSYIPEYSSKQSSPKISMRKQAMECECDAFSFITMLTSLLDASTTASSNSLLPTDLGLQSAGEMWFHLTALACTGVFRILDDGSHWRSEWPNLSHPTPMVRRGFLLLNGLEDAFRLYPHIYTNDAQLRLATACFRTIDLAVPEIWGCRINQDDIREAAEYAPEHFSAVYNAGVSIAPELEKYAYVPIR